MLVSACTCIELHFSQKFQEQPDNCDEETLERSFGSFEENIWSLPEPPIIDPLTQDEGHAQAVDHVVSIDQNLFSQSGSIVVDGQARGTVSDIEEILKDFSSNTSIISDGHSEVTISNWGDGLESFPSPNLLQNTPHMEEVSSLILCADISLILELESISPRTE